MCNLVGLIFNIWIVYICFKVGYGVIVDFDKCNICFL